MVLPGQWRKMSPGAKSSSKVNKAEIQVSGELVAKLRMRHNFNLREVGNLTAKGKLNKIKLFEEYSYRMPEIIEKMNQYKSIFEAGVNYFDEENYELANEQFENYLKQLPMDEVALYFQKKCQTSANKSKISKLN